MEFKLLGPVEILSDAGQTLRLAREKERLLLAVLLVNAGQVLFKEKLISYVWDDDPRSAAAGTFRAYVNRVKRVVDAAGGAAELVTREGGYQLRVPGDCVDVNRFTRLRHEADVAARSGDVDQAVVLLCQGEALWRGPALAGLDGQWASTMRTGLEEERRSCVLKRIGLELDLGRHDELLGELRRLRAQYPNDETRAQYEMKALYWSGRQEDALDVYRHMRECLVDQGLEPGPELVELHRRIYRRDLAPPDAIKRPLPTDRAPAVPRRDTTFVGRQEDIKTLTADGPGTPRIWVISGLSGVGKTRLAVEAANRMPGEVLYLEFHAKDSDQAPLGADGALRRLLEMAGVHRSALPRGRAELAAFWQRELASREMTVILDDVPDTDAVKPLLPVDGSCRVLITTRHRLHGISGASGLGLDILPESDAIALFREIAGEALDANSAAVAVQRCGCLPYAITIAAVGLRRDGRLPASTGPADSAGGSEKSEQLQSVLDSSFESLGEGEQRLIRFLGVNPCPSFTAESAAAIAGVPVRTADEMISSLYDRHLVDHAVGGGFRLHDLLRDYAAIRASHDISRSDRRDAGRRLVAYYLGAADRADRDLYTHRWRARLQQASLPPQRPSPDLAAQARRWLESEWRNTLVTAEYAGRHEWKRYCAELTHVLAEFLDIRGYWGEAVDAHTRALRACRDLGDQYRTARALVDLSRACLGKGLRQEALAHAQESLDIYRSVGDQRGEAIAADRIGVISYFSGNFREMLAYERDARFLYAQSGDSVGEAEAVFHCGIACMELGRLSESLDHFRQSLKIFERSGNHRGAGSALNSIAEANLRQGYHREALGFYRKALLIFRGIGERQKSATLMQNIGRVYLYKGDPERALTEFRCALAAFRQIGDSLWQARAMCDCGDAYLAMDDYEQCHVYYRQAASLAERIGDLHVRAIALRGVADTHRESDRFEDAIRYYGHALKLAQEVQEPYQHAVIMDGIAKTMFRTRKVGVGRIYLRQARDLYQAAGAIEATKSAELRLQLLGDSGPDGGSFPAASA